MAKLKYVVKILHNDRLLASESIEVDDEILDLERERNFNIEHEIGKLVGKVVKSAIEAHDREGEVEQDPLGIEEETILTEPENAGDID